MKTTILFFGMLAEATGIDKTEIENVNNSDTLINYLTTTYPLLKNKTYRVAVNKKLITGNELLSEGDIIALLPPFAGG